MGQAVHVHGLRVDGIPVEGRIVGIDNKRKKYRIKLGKGFLGKVAHLWFGTSRLSAVPSAAPNRQQNDDDIGPAPEPYPDDDDVNPPSTSRFGDWYDEMDD